MGKGSSLVEVLIDLNHILYRGRCLDNSGTEDAAGEVATIGDEVDVGIKIALNLCQRLADLCDVLMLEGLIDTQVVVAPRKMGGSTGLLTSTGGTCDSIDRYILF